VAGCICSPSLPTSPLTHQCEREKEREREGEREEKKTRGRSERSKINI